MRLLPTAALALVAPISAAPAQEAMYREGREKSAAFLNGELDGLWAQMSPALQQALGSIEGLRGFRQALERDFGSEVEILNEEIQPVGPGIDSYLRTSKWSAVSAPVLMQWALTAEGHIAGFTVEQIPVLAESRFLDYETKATLELPVDGEWFVVWGGRTLEQNYHAANQAQRFAMDMLIYRDGATHAGDPGKLESYYCWGQPILAPGSGTIVALTNDLPDNAIGQTDAQHPAGNHVVLDLGNGEFAFLGHMQRGSIAVAVGDKVASGDQLGLCGNSGNTSEPHLHMHLQTTTDLANGEGLPAQFVDYVADGKAVERGELLGGQFISKPQR